MVHLFLVIEISSDNSNTEFKMATVSCNSIIATTFSTVFNCQNYTNSSLLISTFLPNDEKMPLWFEDVPQWYTIFMTFILIAITIATMLNCLTIIILIRYCIYSLYIGVILKMLYNYFKLKLYAVLM